MDSPVSTRWTLTLSCQGGREAQGSAPALDTSLQLPAPWPWLPPALPGETLLILTNCEVLLLSSYRWDEWVSGRQKILKRKEFSKVGRRRAEIQIQDSITSTLSYIVWHRSCSWGGVQTTCILWACSFLTEPQAPAGVLTCFLLPGHLSRIMLGIGPRSDLMIPIHSSCKSLSSGLTLILLLEGGPLLSLTNQTWLRIDTSWKQAIRPAPSP